MENRKSLGARGSRSKEPKKQERQKAQNSQDKWVQALIEENKYNINFCNDETNCAHTSRFMPRAMTMTIHHSPLLLPLPPCAELYVGRAGRYGTAHPAHTCEELTDRVLSSAFVGPLLIKYTTAGTHLKPCTCASLSVILTTLNTCISHASSVAVVESLQLQPSVEFKLLFPCVF